MSKVAKKRSSSQRKADEPTPTRSLRIKAPSEPYHIATDLGVSRVLAESRRMFRANQHLAALKAIQDSFASNGGNADLAAEIGVVLCFLQREDEAVNYLERAQGGERYEELARILSRYTYLRTLMAKRLNAPDALGKSLRDRVKKLVPEEPQDCGITLSACLIVKNEEKHLERCLKSIVNHVDEIVVVDTGSTDSTVEIAASFGAKIGFFKWCDDFAAARNESLRLASSHWALWIDADEEMDPRSWHPIAEGLIRPQFGGYYTKIVNLMDEEGRQQYVHTPVRVFQRLPNVQFEGRVHEQVIQCFDQMDMPAATLENVVIKHYGYMPDDMAEKNKAERTIRMLEREVAESPQDAFHWFNLANAYSVARNPSEALRAAQQCVQFIDPRNGFGSLAYQILASSLNALGRSEEALEACNQAAKAGFFTLLNQFEHAMALLRLGRFQEALQSIDVCLAMEWPQNMTGDYGIFRHKRHAVKGHILLELGLHDEALDLLDFSLSVDPAFAPARFAKGLVLEKMGRLDEALSALAGVLEDVDFAHSAHKASGRICRSQGRDSEAAEFFRKAWSIRSDDTESWLAMVQLLERGAKTEEVLEAYESYAGACSPSADILINWGRALAAAGQEERAIHCMSQAIQADPSNPNAFFNTGDLLYRIGAYADAAHIYEAGLRLQPNSAEGWFVLGNAMAKLGILDGARTAYGQALALDPNHASARYNLAIVSPEAEAAA